MVWFGLEAEEYDRKYADKVLINRIIPYFKPYRKEMLYVIITLTLSSVLNSMIPILISNLIDRINNSENFLVQIILIIIIFLFNIISWVLNWIQQRNSATVVANIAYDLQKNASDAVLKQNLAFFDRNAVGKVVSRVNSDTKSFKDMGGLFMQSVSSFLVVIIVFIPMLIISPFLTLILALMIPFIFLTALSFRKSARKKTLLGQRSTAQVNNFTRETMMGIQIAKVFRQEQKLYDQFNKINRQSYKVNLERGILLNILFPILMLIQSVTVALLIYVGGGRVISGFLSVGDFYLFLQNLWLLFFPLFSVASFWPQFQSGLSALERIFSLIDAPKTIIQNDDRKIEIRKGLIEIEDLDFQYYDNTKVYEKFSLKIDSGESIAIVGHTGAGKSTLAKILGRFYEFQNGSIRIDGLNIRDLNLDHYRSQIAFVPQTPFIWADTLENNIKYGRPSATREDVINVLESAGGADWVDDLPDGIQTNVKEKGKILSMGQKQLVAFARILLEDPRILILDEATASVDPFTEIRIQDALEKTLKNRTSIIIAHRLWTVRRVDRIIVLDHGRIVEQGNHHQLLKQKGYYARLYNKYFRHQSFEYVQSLKDV
ncbi:MAG: ATP-binding cassette domain-containing protein [Candidatus Lokiarchaeota archaeon]|nr:ATP-binding cassette domain-containing protein [Candidatus Lokiarchaeota archaeon]